MADVLAFLKAFLVAVKDDPGITETFRDAASELHDNLASLETTVKPKSRAKPAAESTKG